MPLLLQYNMPYPDAGVAGVEACSLITIDAPNTSESELLNSDNADGDTIGLRSAITPV